MATRITPWRQPKSTTMGGGSQSGGYLPHGTGADEGAPFGVGQKPGPYRLGFGMPVGGGGGSGNDDFKQAWQHWQDSRNEFGAALGRDIGPGRFGAFGSGMLQGALNPQGFDKEIMRAQLTRLAEREAGLRNQELDGLAGSAARSGFTDSATRLGLEHDLRGNSSRRLADAELDFMMQDAGLRTQNRGQSIQAALGLTGIDAQLAQQAAQFAAQQQRPIGDGGPGGPGGDFNLLNPDGSLKMFHEDGTPMTDFEKMLQLQQRQAFMAQFGG